MSSEQLLRPVVDPSLPPDERDLLAEGPDGLTAAGEDVPSSGGRTAADRWWALGIATACGFVPAATLPWLLGGVGALLGALAQVGSAMLWWRFGFGAFLAGGTALQIVSWIVLYACCGDGAREKLGRTHHGRYFLTDDLGGAVQDVVRAQRAVEAVLESELHKAGLLDGDGVDVRAIEWEIAVTGRETTVEKRALRKLSKENRGDDALRLALKPRWRAVNQARNEMRERVSALNAYGNKVRTADRAYRAKQRGESTDEQLQALMAGVRESAAALAAAPAGGEARK
ncbi:hypothetical protein BJF79_06680 [Actinomadura sp. CNU-125]|uniref:hypothetical protein n=1 Tax=Actinomadura sp. CNU-125 TaxID=1904961 RepID=UPI00096A20CA|nr:hypothetical protein [Actinomadura sp. CNU-125]OLT36289.1 hypothetical protein BJF79_06680 [Actinomadura sp. CNU-125]